MGARTAKRQVKSSRLFENRFLEAATHVHPITPLVLWAPVVLYFVYWSLQRMSVLEVLPWAAAGFIVWTLSEYLLHRYLFHFPAKGKIGKMLVFLFHGIHHDEPDDATRLVMPPVPAIFFALIFFGAFELTVGSLYAKPMFAFFMVGYLCYDYIHYATHHFACKGPVMKFLKRHHMLHHHIVKDGNYGVSSPLWDYVFRTFSAGRAKA